MLKNTACKAADGGCYDWVELYNNGKTDADISGWGLSDKETEPYKYVFPDGTNIPANGRLMVFCDSDGAKNNAKIAPFGLSSSGETLTLTDTKRQYCSDHYIRGYTCRQLLRTVPRRQRSILYAQLYPRKGEHRSRGQCSRSQA